MNPDKDAWQGKNKVDPASRHAAHRQLTSLLMPLGEWLLSTINLLREALQVCSVGRGICAPPIQRDDITVTVK